MIIFVIIIIISVFFIPEVFYKDFDIYQRIPSCSCHCFDRDVWVNIHNFSEALIQKRRLIQWICLIDHLWYCSWAVVRLYYLKKKILLQEISLYFVMNSKFFSWLTNVQLSIPDSAQKTAIDKLPLSSQKKLICNIVE